MGIATQDPELRKNFKGTPAHVINFMYFVADELRQIMASLGFRSINEMVGQVEKLNVNKAIKHYKAKGVDVSAILHKPITDNSPILYNTEKQNHNLEKVLDFKIVDDAKGAIKNKIKSNIFKKIQSYRKTELQIWAS